MKKRTEAEMLEWLRVYSPKDYESLLNMKRHYVGFVRRVYYLVAAEHRFKEQHDVLYHGTT